jgi:prevent-host-death family protein
MEQIGSFEAKNHFAALLVRAEQGEEIIITKRGRAVAKLVPAETGFDRAKAQRAVEGLQKARKGVTLGGLKIKDLISEGRD